jgi:hypothetical protein
MVTREDAGQEKDQELSPRKRWWARQDSNLGPMDYESTALTTELRALFIEKTTSPGQCFRAARR